MKYFLGLLLSVLVFSSCEKVIDLKYNDNASGIVIEGNVTNQSGPYFVKITKSVPLGETITNPTIDDAIVRINDDAGNAETLTSQGNGLYKTATLRGVSGRTYTLTVQSENETYTAQSTMPAHVRLDSIKTQEIIFASDTQYLIIPVYLDPVLKGNNYQFMVSVNGQALNQHLFQSDDVTNGLVNTFGLQIDTEDLVLKTGDSVDVTMHCIDSNVGLYYKTLVLIGSGGPGGGITPANPKNNFSNGALGVFSAHTVESKMTRLR